LAWRALLAVADFSKPTNESMAALESRGYSFVLLPHEPSESAPAELVAVLKG
jgi:hypothetical protein